MKARVGRLALLALTQRRAAPRGLKAGSARKAAAAAARGGISAAALARRAGEGRVGPLGAAEGVGRAYGDAVATPHLGRAGGLVS